MLSPTDTARAAWELASCDIIGLRLATRAQLRSLLEREVGAGVAIEWSHTAMVAEVLWCRVAKAIPRRVN